MTTLAKFMILSDSDNRPSMLEKNLYDSWKSIIELYMQNREHGRIILESVEHGLLIWPTIEENGVTRTKRYEELSATEKIQANCDLKERECKLYDAFYKFAHIKGESLHQYYLRFTQLINDMNIYNMKLEQFQVNIKFLNSLPPEWSKFMTDVKLCPKTKRKRDATWFKDKVLLVEAQRSGKVLNEEELEFLADPGVAEAKAVLMANLSSYRSDVLSERIRYQVIAISFLILSICLKHKMQRFQDTNSSAQQDDMILVVFEQLSNQVTNCNKVNKENLVANQFVSDELERYKERVKLLEKRKNMDLSTREKLIMDDIIQEKNAQFEDFKKEINYLKQTLSEHSKEKEFLTKTFNVFKNESKKKEANNVDNEIALEKKVKELDNIICKMGQSAQTMHMLMKPQVFYDNNLKALGFQNPFYLKKAQQIRPMLYDGSVIAKETNVISIANSEETLMLKEESRANDKTGLGYDSQMNKSDLNDVHVNESPVIGNSLIDSHESDGEDNQVNDRFKKSKGYHAVPPPYTGNYMPPRADLSFTGQVNTARPKAMINAVRTNQVNDVKASTCWVWKPIKPDSASITLRDMTMLM
nr:hypothetical protein [Tanacetum cinerariifolium]